MAAIERHVTRTLVSLDATAPCSAAAGLMSERRIGAVGVKVAGNTVGLVTERDLAVRVVGGGMSAASPVGEVMRRDLPRVGPGASEKECADLMRDHATRHLLVEEHGQVVGIISMRDVIRLMLDEKQFLIEQLQTYIDGR
jgi:signal-transduction protein with cAMP-binding, CBS, and nucleotidyltransferase domain